MKYMGILLVAIVFIFGTSFVYSHEHKENDSVKINSGQEIA